MFVRVLRFKLASIVLLIPLTVAAQAPVPGPPAPVVLQPWAEVSVLAALEDPSPKVRYAALAWLVNKQTSNEAIARAAGAYLDEKLPTKVHENAAAALDHMGPAAAAFAPRLTALIADPDPAVSAAAATTLLHMGPAAAQAAPQLAAQLTAPGSDNRFFAAQILSRMGPVAGPYVPQIAGIAFTRANIGGALMLVYLGPAAVKLLPKFAEILKNSAPDKRAAAADCLGDMVALGAPVTNMAPQVAVLLRDPDKNVREAALYALGKMGRAAAPYARQIAALVKKSVGIAGSNQALEALKNMGPAGKAVVPQIAALIKDPNPELRGPVVDTLDKMGAAPEHARQIAALLADSDTHVRLAAAAALNHMAPAAKAPLVPGFAAQLDSHNARQRAAGVMGLGLAGPAAGRYAPNIAAHLKDPDGEVSMAAQEALGRLGPRAAAVLPSLVALLKDPDPARQVRGMGAFKQLGAAAAPAVPLLVAMLNDNAQGSCAEAEQALGDIGAAAAPALARLTALLKSPNAFVRQNAIASLGDIGPPASGAVPLLAELMKSKDTTDRRPVTQALASIGSPDAAVQIASQLKDPAAEVRANAIEVLKGMGPKAASVAPQIASELGDADQKIRGQALETLDGLALAKPLADRSILWYTFRASHVSESEAGPLLARGYLYRTVSPQEVILIRWLGNRSPAERPVAARIARTEAVAALQAFNESFDQTAKYPDVRKEMSERIAEISPVLQ